jgi:hypothetical protein
MNDTLVDSLDAKVNLDRSELRRLMQEEFGALRRRRVTRALLKKKKENAWRDR